MKKTRLPNKLIKALIKDQMQYPGRLVAGTLSLVGRCGVLLALYWYVFQLNGGVVNGTPYIVAAWSLFFYFTFSTFRLRDIARTISRDVQSGNVEVLFNKPMSYLAYRTWWQVGSGLYPFIISSILGSIALALIVGFPTTMTISIFIPTVILVFLMASVLSLAIYIIVGLLAFWIEEVDPIFWIVDKFVMILGGSYLPVALFPSFMYKLAIYSPFGASQFVTHTVYSSWQSDWYFLIGIQTFWAITLSGVVYWMFAQAKQKLSVNGG